MFPVFFALLLLWSPVEADPTKQWPTVKSSHFRVRHQSPYAPAGVLNVLEGLRAKLLLNLIAFAPWARDAVIDVVVYRDAASYHALTGTPNWVGGHVSIAERTVHVYEGEKFQQTMAHELAHLFFDDYFIATKARPPTWLNEGVAKWMEHEYGAEGEVEVAHRLSSQYAPLDDFFLFSYHHGERTSKEVSLWYSQASSLVKFLNREFPSFRFVRLCELLRDGKTIEEAVPMAYGLQVNDLPALERLWRESLAER